MTNKGYDKIMGGDENVLGPIIDAWAIIEQTLAEAGVTGPATNGIADTREEQIARAITARLAAHDPPIFLHYEDATSEESP